MLRAPYRVAFRRSKPRATCSFVSSDKLKSTSIGWPSSVRGFCRFEVDECAMIVGMRQCISQADKHPQDRFGVRYVLVRVRGQPAFVSGGALEGSTMASACVRAG